MDFGRGAKALSLHLKKPVFMGPDFCRDDSCIPKQQWGPASLPAPTVPSLETLPRRARRFARAVSRGGSQDRSPGFAASGVHPEPKLLRFPRGLPVRAEALAVRRLADSEPKSLFPPWRFLGPKPLVPRRAGSRAEAPGSAWQTMSRSSGSCRVRSSRAEARSCPTPPEPKLLLSRWQRANRSSAFCRTSPGPKSGVLPAGSKRSENPWPRMVPHVPEGRLDPVGASRSLPLSHPLKGKPAASAWRRLRQPPCLSLPPALPPESDRPDFHLGCGWEGYPPLPEDRLGHGHLLSRKMRQ
jgi:hypothetical protein